MKTEALTRIGPAGKSDPPSDARPEPMPSPEFEIQLQGTGLQPSAMPVRRRRAVWGHEPTRFLSLGAGVQSTVLLLIACRGEIERPDHVIFADTGWEPTTIYKHLQWLQVQAAAANIPLHITRANTPRVRHIRADAIRGYRLKSGILRCDARMPLFVDDGTGRPGQITRQCSREYKVNPIRKLQRTLMGYRPGTRIPHARAETWIGFSTDEARRASPSVDPWNDNRYPLIELRMSRGDCVAWWNRTFPGRPLVKSACIGCPYHTDAEWARMRRDAPEEFADACEFDRQIRHSAGLRSTAYLHRSAKPLAECDFGESQLDLFDMEPAGLCSAGCML